MNKEKLGWYLAAGLAVVNVGLIAFILFPQFGSVKPGDRPRKMVIERLDFDSKQVSSYDTLIADHRSQVRASNERIRAVKNLLYAQLSLPTDSTVALRDSLVAEIAFENQKLELIHYHHFEQIRELCKPEQQSRFEALAKDLTEIFNKRAPKQ